MIGRLGISVLTTVEFLVAIYDFLQTFYHHYDEEKMVAKEAEERHRLSMSLPVRRSLRLQSPIANRQSESPFPQHCRRVLDESFSAPFLSISRAHLDCFVP